MIPVFKENRTTVGRHMQKYECNKNILFEENVTEVERTQLRVE